VSLSSVSGDTSRRPPEHEHVVAVYDRDEELISAIVSFLSDAFTNRGTAIVVTTPEHRIALEELLAARGFDVKALQRCGNYRSLDARETLTGFMVGDQPDPERFEASVGTIVADAEAAGGPVRLFGEMVALLWDDGLVGGAIELESLWNDLAERHSFALFCAYAMSSLEASGDLAAAKRMCDRHSSVVTLPGIDAFVAESTDEPCVAYERLFVASPAELRHVRDFVRGSLRAWGDEEFGSQVEVIASELATNAVRHAQSPFRVSIERGSSTIRLAVRDASFARPEHLTGKTGVVGGRGIPLVAALSRAWGSESETDGKTVWAEVERHPAS
jgi:anti-sigma regulatory factor (Ser/Thr protein kinase)